MKICCHGYDNSLAASQVWMAVHINTLNKFTSTKHTLLCTSAVSALLHIMGWGYSTLYA